MTRNMLKKQFLDWEYTGSKRVKLLQALGRIFCYCKFNSNNLGHTTRPGLEPDLPSNIIRLLIPNLVIKT